MDIKELTNDDILYIIDCLKAACASRKKCINCPYADKFHSCTLKHIPQEWRIEDIKRRESKL